ncbi:MAG: rhomboid family intramembrane serine protease [Dorea sp.]|nr:rhomboid family intramembrane serine protease [Dorea sp.]
MKNKLNMTVLLAAVNVIVFLALSIQGMTEDAEFMLHHGAMYVPYVAEGDEYYRLFTCMFLHFGFEHLMNNMVVLLIVGWNLEMAVGKVKYLFLYIGSGLCGNVVSAIWDIRTGEYAVSAGASGAVFGMIGGLLYVALRNKGRIGDISGRGIAFMVIVTLYYGFSNTGVDNAAHVGGLLSGFLLAVLLYRKREREYG